MEIESLIEVFSQPPNSKVSFAHEQTEPQKLAKEIVAFANFRGGRVLVGVSDSGEIEGIKRPDFETWVMDTVFGKYITPALIPVYEEINTSAGKIAVISVEQGTLKPYAFRSDGKEMIYIRMGSTSRIANRDQIVQMSQEAGHFHYETVPVSGSKIMDIDQELFIQYYEQLMGEKIGDEDNLILRLRQLDLIHENSAGNLLCSLAGLILFGKEPGRFLSQHGIRVIHYKGTDTELYSISDQPFKAPIGRLKSGSELRRSGLSDLVMQHLSEKLSRVLIEDDGLTRMRKWEIPQGILRELIVNSLVHRDYTRRGINEIRIFSDRFEIESQGRLPNSLTVEKIIAGQRYPRNPILVQFAQNLGLMEHKGLGIRKIVVGQLRQEGFPAPVFVETDESFTVIIQR